MPEVTFTPIDAAVRRITAGEGDLIRAFLSSNLSLSDFETSVGADPGGTQSVLAETGLTLPETGLGDRFNAGQLKAYTDILEGSQSFFDASETFGFGSVEGRATAVDELQTSGLRVPLQPATRGAFDLASDFGFTVSDLARESNLDTEIISSTLAAAGLNLPGPTTLEDALGNDGLSLDELVPGTPGTVVPGEVITGTRSDNVSFLEGAFSGVPQAPGVKLGFLRGINRDRSNPNIKSGPRGVTQNAPVRKNILRAGSI